MVKNRNPGPIFTLELFSILILSSLVQPIDISLGQTPQASRCITYDPEEKLIRITCNSASMTDIDNQLKNPNILHKEAGRVWVLNSGIVIEQGATLHINSTDTSWLKIAANGESAYPIRVLGSLKIDSVKISSWNPEANDYLKFKHDVLPGKELEHAGIDAIP